MAESTSFLNYLVYDSIFRKEYINKIYLSWICLQIYSESIIF